MKWYHLIPFWGFAFAVEQAKNREWSREKFTYFSLYHLVVVILIVIYLIRLKG